VERQAGQDRDLQRAGARVAVAALNLAGDAQADLRVHGGSDKAVYAYPSEYYELWSRERPELELGPGTFGENLTTEGVLDEDASIGDRFRVGTLYPVAYASASSAYALGLDGELAVAFLVDNRRRQVSHRVSMTLGT
jgi:MOSC domain